MPPGSGRTLCGDRARCGVETNGDTHIRDHIRAPRHVCSGLWRMHHRETPSKGPRSSIRIHRAAEIRATRRAHNEEICIFESYAHPKLPKSRSSRVLPVPRLAARSERLTTAL